MTELSSNMSMCICARMRKVDIHEQTGDAPLKEKKDEVRLTDFVTASVTAYNAFCDAQYLHSLVMHALIMYCNITAYMLYRKLYINCSIVHLPMLNRRIYIVVYILYTYIHVLS